MDTGISGGFKRAGEDSTKVSEAKKSLNVILLIVTAIMGAVAWFAGSLVYAAFSRTLPMPLLIGIIFALLAVLTVFTVLIVSKFMGTYFVNLFTGRATDGVVLYLIAGIVVIFAMAVLFQWLYGLSIERTVEEPTSYIFVIDDSGSMTMNDPGNQRFSAIGTLLESKDQDFQYAIYTFASEVTLVKGMTKVCEGPSSITTYSEGGTYMGEALFRVIDDINSGVIDGGTNPKVILITDGAASDIGFLESLRKFTDGYCDRGIVISTIGLGSANRAQLESIAGNTGGVFVSIDDATQLNDAVSEAALGKDSRDLVSARAHQPNDWVYGVMRVVFLTLLATAIGICAAYAYGLKGSFEFILVGSAIKALLAALIVELGTNLLGGLGFLPVFAASVLTATTIAVMFTVAKAAFNGGTPTGVVFGEKKKKSNTTPKRLV